MAVIEVKQIVGRIGPCESVAFTISTVHAVVVARKDFAAKRLILVLYVFITNIALQGQAFDRIYFQITVAEDTPAAVLVVTGIIDFLYRVGDVGTGKFHRRGEVAVGIVDRDGRVLTHGCVRNTAVGIGGNTEIRPLAHHEVLAYFHILRDIVIRVQADTIAAVESLVDQTILIDVIGTEEHRSFF